MSRQRTFDKDLAGLKQKLLRMGAVAETMIDKVAAELERRDERVAEQVPDLEQHLNALQIEVDRDAMSLLATQQPVASDLRFLVSAIKINADLERIGDLAVNIMQAAQVLTKQQPIRAKVDIARMAGLAREMVADSLRAFVSGDALQAQRVIDTDDQVDALKYQVLRQLIEYMTADPSSIERGVAVIFTSRHLERIADHATNIAEDVIYMTQGRDVRHPKSRGPRPGR